MTDSLTIDISAFTPQQVLRVLEAVRNVRADDELRRTEVDLPDWQEAESTGWTHEHVEHLRESLAKRGKQVQLAAFEAALENGGYISRSDLFALAGYEPDRKLNNWTTPFRRIASELVEDHGLPEDAALPMEAGYTDAPGYQQTHGFVVAPEIVKLVQHQA